MVSASWWMLALLETDGEATYELVADGAQPLVEAISSFHFTFESALVCLSLLILVSIFFDKFGAKLGMPGSIFLFYAGFSFIYWDTTFACLRWKRFVCLS